MLILAAAVASTTTTTVPQTNFIEPNGTIIVELILFLIVFGIVAKFILPPLQKVMDARDSTVRSALEASDEGRSEAERLEAESRETLASARAAARASLEEAGRQAEAARTAERDRGQVEHDRLLAAAEVTLTAEAARTRQELASRLETVVIAAAERVVGLEVDANRHRALFDRAVESLTHAERANQP